jgi:hypothetical protein
VAVQQRERLQQFVGPARQLRREPGHRLERRLFGDALQGGPVLFAVAALASNSGPLPAITTR